MAIYLLKSWKSAHVEELVDPVIRVLRMLPSHCEQGCLSTSFNDWGIVSHMDQCPHNGRYSATFCGEDLPLATLPVDLGDNLGDVRVAGEAVDIVLTRSIPHPPYGFHGEREGSTFLSINEQVSSNSTVTRSHDQNIITYLEETAMAHGLSPQDSVVRVSAVHGMPTGMSTFSYAVELPVLAGSSAIRQVLIRFAPPKARMSWEVIGRSAVVEAAILSMAPGVSIGGDIGHPPISANAQTPTFELERVSWQRPVVNFATAQLGDVARVLGTIQDSLIRPRIYFGPLAWPGRSLAPKLVLWNYLSISKLENMWQAWMGMHQYGSDDPSVAECRRGVQDIIKTIRPTDFIKVRYQRE